MDNRKNNGAKVGEDRGQGRKPKATELELIELLSPLDEIAFKAIKKGVIAGEFPYIKLFLEYRYGRPKQQIEVQAQQAEQPLFSEIHYEIDYTKLSDSALKEIVALRNKQILI